MKLLVRSMRFRFDVGRTVEAVLGIPQAKEIFDEGFEYLGEIEPGEAEICVGYYDARIIFKQLPRQKDAVQLILSSDELRGESARIAGMGQDGKAIVTNSSYISGVDCNHFAYPDVGFSAVTFGEIGHALGLQHHPFNPRKWCEMSHNELPGPEWKAISRVHFCRDCYKTIAPQR